MNLAGDYASACHHVIHRKIAAAIGARPVQMVENPPQLLHGRRYYEGQGS
jgi:hypothetical protein